MKLGILVTDQLDSQISEKFGSYPEMFQALLIQIDPSLTFSSYSVIDQTYPETIDECDAYLITGSKFSAHEDKPWINQLCNYIQTLHRQQKKLIGICFGHQLIARALGGKTEKSTQGWGIGSMPVDIFQHPNWLQPSINIFNLLVSHQDQVSSLPSNSALIAGSKFCPHASYQVGNHILTFQGHPEFSKNYSQYLMEKRREIIGGSRVNEGILSLNDKINHLEVARWMVNFLAE
jgi:GMP synthase-like glutamine amidotransferase